MSEDEVKARVEAAYTKLFNFMETDLIPPNDDGTVSTEDLTIVANVMLRMAASVIMTATTPENASRFIRKFAEEVHDYEEISTGSTVH